MKKKTLLFGAIALLMSSNSFSQVDCTPKNWKFDTMERGSAASMFAIEGCGTGYNFKSLNLENGRKGFRYADNLDGAFCALIADDGVGRNYSEINEAQKAKVDAFMEAHQIVDGGDLGNILIYQGANSTENDPRAIKNTINTGGAVMFVASQKDLTAGFYKVSIPVRIVVNSDLDNGTKINLNLGTSWWDGLQFANNTNTGYGTYAIEAHPFFNNEWTMLEFEFQIKNNPDPKYDFTPIMIKLGLGATSNNSILLYNDFKLEKISAPTLGGTVIATPLDWNDTPSITGTTNLDENKFIAFANSNGITVIDANQTIEVYNASGAQINSVEPLNTVTNISISEKGIYIVKVGKNTRKVIL